MNSRKNNDLTLLNTIIFRFSVKYRIGRDSSSDIYLPAPTVSLNHALVYEEYNEIFIVDLRSNIGTFVNGLQICKPQRIHFGDHIQIGPYKLIINQEGINIFEIAEGIRLETESLMLSIDKGKNKKELLKNIDLTILPGEFVTIVGGSGAGKSTLLKALLGIYKPEGKVRLNQDELLPNYHLYRSIIGYVPQDEIIHKELTVYSSLSYSAKLRLPPDTSIDEIDKRIFDVLEKVELTNQKYQIINKLSGGQRKRVGISVELLADPRILFLDEPTSGLDPGLDKKMMHILRQLANQGKTIILVTHATANINFCDLICFLSFGRLVYYGPPKQAFEFFSLQSENFSDIYDLFDDPDLIKAINNTNKWADRYKESKLYKEFVEERKINISGGSNKSRPIAFFGEKLKGNVIREENQKVEKRPNASSFRQFKILSYRYFELIRRDKMLLLILSLIMPIIGILLILISKDNWLIGDSSQSIENILTKKLTEALIVGKKHAIYTIVGNSQTLLFMFALAAVLFGIFSSAYEIVKERHIYERERMVFLKLVPYLSSKIFILSLFGILQCLLIIKIVSVKVVIPRDGILFPTILELWITLSLGTITAIILGLFISSLVKSMNMVIYIILGILFYQIIFAGVIFDIPKAIGSVSSNLTLTRWTMEALGSTLQIEELNRLSIIRYDPDPITDVVTFEIEIPDRKNPLHLVKETQTKSITINPKPIDIHDQKEFNLNYSSNESHLKKVWSILLLFSLGLFLSTVFILRIKDG